MKTVTSTRRGKFYHTHLQFMLSRLLDIYMNFFRSSVILTWITIFKGKSETTKIRIMQSSLKWQPGNNKKTA